MCDHPCDRVHALAVECCTCGCSWWADFRRRGADRRADFSPDFFFMTMESRGFGSAKKEAFVHSSLSFVLPAHMQASLETKNSGDGEREGGGEGGREPTRHRDETQANFLEGGLGELSMGCQRRAFFWLFLKRRFMA